MCSWTLSRRARRCREDGVFALQQLQIPHYARNDNGNQDSRLTRNPKAFNSSGGTYLSSLLRSTHSRSSVDLWYCSGESLRESTTFSNELAEKAGAAVARDVVGFEFPRWGATSLLSFSHYSC